MRHFACRQIGKVALRQRLQDEAGATGADRQHAAIAGGVERDLGPLGELAHDLVEHMGGHGCRAPRPDLGRDRLDDFELEIGGLERQLGMICLDQHIGENRNGVAAFDHAMDMTERFQQRGAFDGDFHVFIPPVA